MYTSSQLYNLPDLWYTTGGHTFDYRVVIQILLVYSNFHLPDRAPDIAIILKVSRFSHS